MMSNTVELTVHEDSFSNRPTVNYSSISSIRRHEPSRALTGTLVAGVCDEPDGVVLVTESPAKVRRLCAEKPIPCEEDRHDDT